MATWHRSGDNPRAPKKKLPLEYNHYTQLANVIAGIGTASVEDECGVELSFGFAGCVLPPPFWDWRRKGIR